MVWCGEAVSFAWGPNGRRVALIFAEPGGTSAYPSESTFWTSSRGRTGPSSGSVSAAFRLLSFPGLRTGRGSPMPAEASTHRPAQTCPISTCSSCAGRAAQPFGPDLPHSGRPGRRTGNGSPFDAVAADPAGRRNLHGRSPRNGPPVRGTRRRARLVTRREDDRVRDELRYTSRNPVRQNVTPRLAANRCGAPGSSGPPVWSPDGTKLAAETTHKHGIYAMDKRGGGLQWVSLGLRETRTWYRRLPGRPSWRPTH
jgi:hypothetical protein